MKTHVKVPTESYKQKKLRNIFFVGLLKANDEKSRMRIRICIIVYGSKDPDPSKNVTDPEF
jgi:hypothetical protein